jgi:hypothetical protein
MIDSNLDIDYRWEDDADYQGWIHEDELPDFVFCRKQLKRMMEVMYGNGDMEDLKDALEGLCSELDEDFEDGTLRIYKQ